ncbi:MAG: RHS repeat-associated core domain-containing protein, partial [Leifsonia sp.]
GGTTLREYDADSRLIRQTLPNGDEAWADYDPCGRPVAVHQPGSGTARYSYGPSGRVKTARDLWWGIRKFDYDTAGQLTAVTNGLGGVTRYDYDDRGRVTQITDPLGGVTRREWDANNRLVAETDPLGRATIAGYDLAGRQAWQKDPAGRTLTFDYDETGRIAATSVDGNLVSAISRDVTARTITIDDRTGPSPVTQQLEWDRGGNLIRYTRTGTTGHSDTGQQSWGYDPAGRRTSMTDAFGRTTHYTYNPAGQLSRVEHPAFGAATFSYDPAGNLATAANDDTLQTWDWADGTVTSHTTTDPTGSSHTDIHRDDAGHITLIDRDGILTRYGYDQAGQLTEATTGDTHQKWVFDTAGRLTQQTDHNGDNLYSYDPAGQLLAIHHPDGSTTRHEYDSAGRRTHTADAGGSRRDFTWSPTGWLAGVADTTGDTTTRTTLHVDATSQLAQIDGLNTWWDTAAGTPTLNSVGDTAVLPLGPLTGIGDTWTTPGWRSTRADTTNPWQVDPATVLPTGIGLTSGGTLTIPTTGALNGIEWLGARAYDPTSHSFLSTDPVPPVTGAGWAGNPYSYAGNNPLAFTDPTGLHPLTDAQLKKQTQGWLAGAWDATTNWVGNNWEYIAGGAMVVAGGVLMVTGVGGPVGAMLLSAGADTIIQKATTGHVNWGEVAVSGALGGIGGGAAIWAKAASEAGTSALVTTLGINGGVGAITSEGTYLMQNSGHLTWNGALGSAVGGAIGGAVAGAAGPAGGTIAKELLGTTSNGVKALMATAGITAVGGAGANLTQQLITDPGKPVNLAKVAVSSAASVTAGAAFRNVPIASSKNMYTLKQIQYTAPRTLRGAFSTGPNSVAQWVSSGIGGMGNSALTLLGLE